jgi:hypothetical protein
MDLNDICLICVILSCYDLLSLEEIVEKYPLNVLYVIDCIRKDSPLSKLTHLSWTIRLKKLSEITFEKDLLRLRLLFRGFGKRML